MSEHVIALDPGGRSGWASARMSEDSFELTDSGVLRQDMMARWLADAQAIRFLNKPWKVAMDAGSNTPIRAFDVIVAESWRPRRKNGKMDWIENDPLLSAQHLGQIRLIADLSGAAYREYPPSQKDAWVASMPAKLKALDDYSSEQHDQDARWHLWGYFFENWFSASVDVESVIGA